MRFKFLHAADLHLDSPLLGLSAKSPEFAARVADASRGAFDNLVALAIEEGCKFVLFAGDVFDGEWRDYKAGLFFVERMRRLREVGIQVFVILGNHDAENKFIARLEFSDNVRLFSKRAAESIDLPDLDVVIHGRSFAQRDVTENLASTYPPPIVGRLNIGMLHTACGGRPGHTNYAPCTLEQLVRHGYDYWALGHVHAREVLNENPHVVFPGNLQGRHIREIGPKGATLVSVEDGSIVGVEHRPLDTVRWALEVVDVSDADTLGDIVAAARGQLDGAHRAADGRALAVRLQLIGDTSLHSEIVAARPKLIEEIETAAATVGSDVWLESMDIATRPPDEEAALDPSVGGLMLDALNAAANDDLLNEALEKALEELGAKFPNGAHREEVFDRIRIQSPARAQQLARAVLELSAGRSDAD